MVGRELELAVLTEVNLPAGGVVVAGDVGVGKTRLLRAALARAGVDAEWVVATRAAAAVSLPVVWHLLPDRERPVRGPLAALTGLARRFAGRRPVVVAVDDAHLLDEASAAVLHQLAARGLVRTTMTVRSGESCCDAVAAIWKEPTVRVSLRPLAAAAVDSLVDVALGPTDPFSRKRIRRLVRGNPLLLREFLADATEAGGLVLKDGLWRWGNPTFCGPRLDQLVSSHVSTVAPGVRRVLETIACGEPAALHELERIADADAVEAAERSGLAVCDTTGPVPSVRLVHPLYAEVLRARMPASRRRAVCAALAAGVGDTADPEQLVRAAVREVSSGVLTRPEMVVKAAEHAVSTCDLALAERLVRAVCEREPT